MSNSSENRLEIPETSEKIPKLPANFDLSAEFAKFLQYQMNPALPNPPPSTAENLVIKVKLNSNNYSLWCNLMRRALMGRGGAPTSQGSLHPLPTDANFAKWEQDDQLVFTWLIDNMEESLVNNASSYPTAKALWDGLTVTYGFGTDPLQTFDLHKQAYTMRQGTQSLDACWEKLQSLWRTIDNRTPNPMECPHDIQKFNQYIQEQRLYQLLMAVDERFAATKKEILKQDPRPTAEAAYGKLRRSDAENLLLKITPSVTSSGVGLGQGLTAKGQGGSGREHPEPPRKGGNNPRSGPPSRRCTEKKHLKCSHCKKKGHSREDCFKLHGYPEWWEDFKRKTQGAAAQVTGGGEGSSTGGKTETGGPWKDQLNPSTGGHLGEEDSMAAAARGRRVRAVSPNPYSLYISSPNTISPLPPAVF